MNKPPLYIMHVNRKDLTIKAYLSVCNDFDVTIINNSDDTTQFDHDNKAYTVYTPPIPFTFSQSHRLMLKWANMRGLKHYYWMHNDGVSNHDTNVKLIEYVDNLRGTKWGTVFTHYDVLACLNTEAMNSVSSMFVWYEQYYLDSSLYYMMRCNGYPTLDTGLKVKHYNGTGASATIQSDPKLAFRNGGMSGMYARLYEIMWGGTNGNEKYTIPFDGKGPV